MRWRSAFLLGIPLTLVAAAPFGYGLATPPPASSATKARAPDTGKAAQRLCASRTVNERLKAQIFAEASSIGHARSARLERLASFSEVRMDQPIVRSRDEELGVTICSGRFALLLPPGSRDMFEGRTLLEANVEYAAQPAADGSGIVYQLRGADSIAYRLAAAELGPDDVVSDSEFARAELPLVPQPAAIAAAPAPEPVPPPTPVKLAEAEPAPAKLAKVEAEPKPAVAKRDREAKPDKTERKTATRLAAKQEKPPKKQPKASAREKRPADTKLASAKTGKAKPGKAKDASKSAKVALARLDAPKKPARKEEQSKSAVKRLQRGADRKAPDKRQPDKRAVATLASAKAQSPKPVRKPERVASRPQDRCGGSVAAQLLCSRPALAAKQRVMNNFYNSALEGADVSTRWNLNGTRSRFLAYLAECRSESCVADALDDRIAEIQDIVAQS